MRNAPLLLALVIGMPLAGCVDVDDANPASTSSGPSSSVAPPGGGTLEAATVNESAEVNFTAVLTGGFALDFTLVPDEKANCELVTKWLPTQAPWGYNGFILDKIGTQVNWMIMGSGWHEAHLHVEDVDTRGKVAYLHDDSWMEIQWPYEAIEQPVAIVLGLEGLVPDKTEPNEPNFLFSLTCDAPFSLQNLNGGASASLFNGRSMRRGASVTSDAYVPPGIGLSAGVTALVETTFASKGNTKMLLIDSYEHVGRAELTHPGGTKTYDLPPHFDDEPPVHVFTGPRGNYRLQLTEIDMMGGDVWGAFLELHPMVTVEDVLKLPKGHGHACVEDDAC